MTKGQDRDLITIKRFIPEELKHIKITDEDVKMFFDHSERGIEPAGKKDINGVAGTDGYKALYWGKKRRGLNMELWETGVLEGYCPYMELVEGESRELIDFIKKDMFKGMDAEIIEYCYQETLNK